MVFYGELWYGCSRVLCDFAWVFASRKVLSSAWKTTGRNSQHFGSVAIKIIIALRKSGLGVFFLSQKVFSVRINVHGSSLLTLIDFGNCSQHHTCVPNNIHSLHSLQGQTTLVQFRSYPADSLWMPTMVGLCFTKDTDEICSKYINRLWCGVSWLSLEILRAFHNWDVISHAHFTNCWMSLPILSV